MDPKQFVVAAGIRAIKTFAQALIAVIGTGALGVFEVDWQQALSVAAMAAVLSVLTSVASMPFGEKGTPGLPGEDVKPVEVDVVDVDVREPKQWEGDEPTPVEAPLDEEGAGDE